MKWLLGIKLTGCLIAYSVLCFWLGQWCLMQEPFYHFSVFIVGLIILMIVGWIIGAIEQILEDREINEWATGKIKSS